MPRIFYFKPIWALLLVAIVFIGGNATAIAGITLSQDFDSGSLDVASSTVNGNQIELVGRKTWTNTYYNSYYDLPYNESYRWFYFNASGVLNQEPSFSINTTQFLGDLSDHVFVYSYDQVNWQYFDSAAVSGTTYSFSNSTPFTQDSVYVAYNFPYSVSRLENYVNSIKSSPYVSPTNSSSSDLILGQGAGGIDDLGRTIEGQNLYAFKITNQNVTTSKQKVVLVGGNHACETIGNIALEGMLDFLLSDAPAAQELLAAAEFYVYPMVNPDGRYAGYYRSSVENPDRDTNRYWNNPSGMTQLSLVTSAMDADISSEIYPDWSIGDADYFFDFHQYFGPWSDPDYYHIINEDPESTLQQYIGELLPDVVYASLYGSSGMSHVWANWQFGLDAECSLVAEFGAHPGTTEAEIQQRGALYALALHHTIVGVPEPTVVVSIVMLLLAMILQTTRRRNRDLL